MTGYEISKMWFDWALQNPDLNTPTHTALFMWYAEKWNRVGRNEKFSVTTSEAMDAIGVKSRNTISKIMGDLVEFGFIKIVTEARNQYSCNVISLAQNITNQMDDIRTALGQQEDSTISGTIASTRTINKDKSTKPTKVPKERSSKEFIAPTIIEVEKYFIDNGYTKESGQRAWNYYNAGDWKNRDGKQVVNWKQTMQSVWFKDGNKIKEQQSKKLSVF